VQIALHDNAITDNQSKTALCYAVDKNNFPIVRCLIEMTVSDSDRSLLLLPACIAARNGHLEMTQLFFQNGAPLDATLEQYDQTSLHEATWMGHLNVVEFLMEQGAKLNLKDISGSTPLHLACKRGHLEIVKFLFNKNALVTADNDGNYPIHLAITGCLTKANKEQIEQQQSKIETLVKYHKKNRRFFENLYLDQKVVNQSFHLECQQAPQDIVQVIIESDSTQMEVRDRYGNTALLLAMKEGHFGIVRLLTEMVS
jgi:ankyrin repeat protein